MKKTLFAAILLLLLLPLASRAQHFEWATGFGGSTQGNGDCLIKGSVTDDEGNLYILGQFNVNDTWNNGPRLLPMAPYGPGHATRSALIAKISPNGEMLWKKVIHCNNGFAPVLHDIKKVGDTAFACLLNVTLPTNDNYCYYLDTLLPTFSDYPLPLSQDTSWPYFTTFILFGFDGEVKEQHFLQYSLIDSAGNDAVVPLPCGLNVAWKFYLSDISFDIDSEGNIYLVRRTEDLSNGISVTDGTVLGAKFWVDNRCVGMTYTHGKRSLFDPQILKFSPHFDTLLADRYVVQRGLNDSISYYHNISNIKVDIFNNIYYLNTLDMGHSGSTTLVIDSLQNIQFTTDANAMYTAYLVKYTSNLNPLWMIHLDDSVINATIAHTSYRFLDIDFDDDSNLLFLSGSTGRGAWLDTLNYYSVLSYQGIPLNLIKNDVFFMAFHNSSSQPDLFSYGKIPALMISESEQGDIACQKNRLFVQSENVGGIRYPGRDTRYPHTSDWGIGFTVFDYSGNIIDGQDYNAISSSNRSGPISLHDSNLYLMQALTTDATFGNIHLSVNERMASIAKYVDPAFMTPYVYTGDTGDVRIALTPDVGAFTSYPNPFRQRVWIRVENATLLSDGGSPTALLTDLQGRQETVRLEPQGDGRYLLDLSSRPQASYVLTLTTADGHQHSLTLLSQHDRFGN